MDRWLFQVTAVVTLSAKNDILISYIQGSLSIRPSYGAGGEEILEGGGGRGRRERKA